MQEMVTKCKEMKIHLCESWTLIAKVPGAGLKLSIIGEAYVSHGVCLQLLPLIGQCSSYHVFNHSRRKPTQLQHRLADSSVIIELTGKIVIVPSFICFKAIVSLPSYQVEAKPMENLYMSTLRAACVTPEHQHGVANR
jgi:hypothetical protein